MVAFALNEGAITAFNLSDSDIFASTFRTHDNTPFTTQLIAGHLSVDLIIFRVPREGIREWYSFCHVGAFSNGNLGNGWFAS